MNLQHAESTEEISAALHQLINTIEELYGPHTTGPRRPPPRPQPYHGFTAFINHGHDHRRSVSTSSEDEERRSRTTSASSQSSSNRGSHNHRGHCLSRSTLKRRRMREFSAKPTQTSTTPTDVVVDPDKGGSIIYNALTTTAAENTSLDIPKKVAQANPCPNPVVPKNSSLTCSLEAFGSLTEGFCHRINLDPSTDGGDQPVLWIDLETEELAKVNNDCHTPSPATLAGYLLAGLSEVTVFSILWHHRRFPARRVWHDGFRIQSKVMEISGHKPITRQIKVSWDEDTMRSAPAVSPNERIVVFWNPDHLRSVMDWVNEAVYTKRVSLGVFF